MSQADKQQEDTPADVAATAAQPAETAQTVEPVPSPSTRRPSPPPARSLRRDSSPAPAPQRVTSAGTCGVSFYWEPQPTASGERFDPEALTAAHKSLPFNTRVRVTNPANGKSVVVRINDRGPYIDGRCLDLARGAFRHIADLDTGVLRAARYEVLS